ncbi:MAG: CoA pyrophosphatase [Negativicutes bacterium]|nr:CoA pyrophosphatase [Negativicutes bacterium]
MEICTKLTAALQARQPKIENESDYFASAVLIPLANYKGELRVLFEVRSPQLAWQPGEICFPGGRIEEEDASAFNAALRETSEELGIPWEQIRPLGALDYLVSPIGVIIYPFVGFIDRPEDIRPNCDEVGRIFSVPLDYLLSAVPLVAHMELATRPLGDFPLHLMPENYPQDWKRRATYEVFFYQYKEFVIWGLTARVLHQFLQICKSVVGRKE